MRKFKHRSEKRRKLLRARELRDCPTPAEAQAWSLLRKRRFAGLKFRRQHVLFGFIVDFYCPSLRLAVEVDGGVRTDQDQIIYDVVREAELWERGIAVVRIKNEDISEEGLRAALSPYLGASPSSRMRQKPESAQTHRTKS
jgi:very-short-patch-repair endonuclease